MRNRTSSIDPQAQVSRLARLATELGMGLTENHDRATELIATAKQKMVDTQQQLDLQESANITELEHEFNATLATVRREFEEAVAQLEHQRGVRSDEAIRQRTQAVDGAADDFEQTTIQLQDERTHDEQQIKKSHAANIERYQQAAAVRQVLETQARQDLQRNGVQLDSSTTAKSVTDKAAWSSTLFRSAEQRIREASNQIAQLQHGWASRFLAERWSLLAFVGFACASAYPLGRLQGFQPFGWVTATLMFSGIGTGCAHLLARRSAASASHAIKTSLGNNLLLAKFELQAAEQASRRETDAGLTEFSTRTEEQASAAEATYQTRMNEAQAVYDNQSQRIETAFTAKRQELESIWNERADKIRAHYRPTIESRRSFFQSQKSHAAEQAALQIERCETEQQQTEHELKQRWREANQSFSQLARDIESQCVSWHRASDQLNALSPSKDAPAAIQLGQYQFELTGDSQPLAEVAQPAALPAVLSFPSTPSLTLQASGAGREQAIRVLQNATLRMLTAFPPGSLRLTILDPVGLGQNFSAFMHLADYDERLISHRIWTETPQITQRLTDLTEHMENVIQTYLRNDYQSIQEYNQQAGEVAEPFRLLVIANFPNRFSDDAVRRLRSIATSGPRCGIHTLMSVDSDAKLPKNVQLDDLTANSKVLHWQGDRFMDPKEPFATMPLTLDEPPDSRIATELIQQVGRQAQVNSRVEVPFATVAPAKDEIWQADCSEELLVPLGRASATKPMNLRLGRGTAQHVLISGKTGSGKSTLLNALITNASLRYSPEQLQFFLIDFKKGVEFKAYADLELPHARVIAIESEREFGMSVLQQLDNELRARGERFREAGVQTLAAFRGVGNENRMPRLLLVVDEFQEFFVSDDKIAHEATLLLDRLVRQGRAFGIHVILGSQTLAGAYSLARSTLGQMAVRIALECSSTDAHLILSEDNTAARLLGRPGEAIYNDANGRVEGNHPFQIVWLPDDQRNEALKSIRDHAAKSTVRYEQPLIFEGHAAAAISDNRVLHSLLENPLDNPSPRLAQAWLGAAIAIKEPTSAVFRRQGGSNLVVVGQSEESARGMIASSLVGLVAAHANCDEDGEFRCDCTFTVLDGGRANTTESALADHLQHFLPTELNVQGASHTNEVIAAHFEKLEDRLRDPAAHLAASNYLVIYDIARFRELQPSDDNFGLGRFGEASSDNDSSTQLARILRDGPAVGLHTIVWADCYHTLSRWFERGVLRDFGLRVLQQMTATDSSHLMDSAMASQLGSYRAILYDHDRGTSEKFRPYAMPNADWLQTFRSRVTRAFTI